MNGKYIISSGEKTNVPWNDDYASKGHEYFDVWAPEISTHYGDAFWTSQGVTPLPDHIVKRFAGKVMAITGYEQDQVMVQPQGQPGVHPEQDVSVPINWAYNHHYMAWMTGKAAELKEIPAEAGDYSNHGAPTKWVAVEKPEAPRAPWEATGGEKIPTNQMFSEGNGGESRKSFHGYPSGYAQLLESPTTWMITPMQIDTRNRDCGVNPADVTNCTQFTPGPEPRQARYGRGIPAGTNYSGILECPCNGKYGGDPIFYPKSKTKVVDHEYAALTQGPCSDGQHITTAQQCFDAAAGLEIFASKVVNATQTAPALPSGCSTLSAADGTLTVTYNKGGGGKCGSGGQRVGTTALSLGVSLHLDLQADPTNAAAGNATMTLTGPATVWFGVGLDAQRMSDAPYTLVVTATGVREQKIGTCGSEAEHCAGDALAPSITLLSNTVVKGVRTVVLSRPFKGATKDHYTFGATSGASLNFIAAVGSSPVFAYHKAHMAGLITVTSPGEATCVCDLGTQGEICHPGGKACNKFTKSCSPGYHGEGSLKFQRNPTCNSRQYSGGLSCCVHKQNLLDADQPIPPQLLKYHMKFRFWFQEYVPPTATARASHHNLPRIYYQTEANAGEYDIPPAFRLPHEQIVGYDNYPMGKPTPGTTCTGTCPAGPDCACEHTLVYKWTVSNMKLLYAGGHCHAPSCIGLWLYRNDTGTPQLLCHQRPVYGTGNVAADKYDEAGYLALPPCLWGADAGLEPPQWLGPNTPLVSVKKNRNTHTGHFGEMASWQMRGVFNQTY